MTVYPSQYNNGGNSDQLPPNNQSTQQYENRRNSNAPSHSNSLNGNGTFESQQPQQNQQDSQITRAKTNRDPAVQKRLAMQLEYQKSLAKLSLGDDNDDDDSEYNIEATDESRQTQNDYSTMSGKGNNTQLSAHGHNPINVISPPVPTIPSSYFHNNNNQNYSQQTIPQSQQHYDSVNNVNNVNNMNTNIPHELSRSSTTSSSGSSVGLGYPPVQPHQYSSSSVQHNFNAPFDQGSQYQNNNVSPPPVPSLPYKNGYHFNSGNNWNQSQTSGFSPNPHNSMHGAFNINHNNMHGSFNGHASSYPYTPPEAQLLLEFNPGILSTISVAFRQKMLENETKRSESTNYGLEFPVTFTGKEAIDVIVELTQLDDRRHGLSIARSMESQFLLFGGGDNKLFDSNNDQYFFSEATLAYLPGKTDFPSVPKGVFPYSTKCYSYGCIPGDAKCYSYLCPNRRHLKHALGRQNSDASSLGSQEKVWANSVPASIVAAASKKERARQEAIFEVVTTEHNYVRDLELIEEIFVNPLREGGIIDAERVEEFIEDVFLNYKEIHELNKKLLEQLKARQEEQQLVENIGDILLTHVIGFEEAYTKYIPQIVLSEFVSKKEEASNPKYAQFLKDCTRHPEARRLGLLHFVGQPYQRIPRYPLLLNEVIKKTDETVEDRQIVQEVVKVCSELGKKIESCMPESARRLRLLNVQDKVYWKLKESQQDLKLGDKSRRLLFECIAKRRATFDVQATGFRLFLFDHMLLMTKEKKVKQADKDSVHYQVFKNPIPLELASVWPDDGKPVSVNAREQLGSRPRSKSSGNTATSEHNGVFDTPVTVRHQGQRGGESTFYMILSERDELIRQVEEAQEARKDTVSRQTLFQLSLIVESNAQQSTAISPTSALDGKRTTCTAVYLNVLDGKKRVVVGTESGLYVGMDDDPFSFKLTMKDVNVSDIKILEDFHLVVILSGKVLKAYNMHILEPNSDKAFQNGYQISKNVLYMEAGICAGKTLVIAMKKKSAGESHFSAYEPLENASFASQSHRSITGLSLGKSKSEWFKLYREFYVPSESSKLLMLSRMVCVVTPKGFDVLTLDNLEETRTYPNRQDTEYEFLLKRPNSIPVSMFKINKDEFLMCYSDFAFVMTKNGSLAKTGLIEFEARAESFSMIYPYIIAFEQQLVEVRNIETGALEQLVLGDNIRVTYNEVDLTGNNVIHITISHPTRSDVRRVLRVTKSQPKTFLEPVRYQPKSSYTPQSLQPAPSTSQTSPPYNPYRPAQAQQILVDAPAMPSMPQRLSPRMSQMQPSLSMSQNNFPLTTTGYSPATTYTPSTTYSPTTVSFPSGYSTMSPSMTNMHVYPAPSTPTTSSFPSPSMSYSGSYHSGLHHSGSHHSGSHSSTSPSLTNNLTYPAPITPPMARASVVYPPASSYGNALGGDYQPAPFNVEPVRMPMPRPSPDTTPIQTHSTLSMMSPPSNPGFSTYPHMSSTGTNPYGANPAPYTQYPQVYPPPASGHPRAPSPTAQIQQTWVPTGFP